MSKTSPRYSARVRITLHVDGQTYRVAQIGGGRLIFDSPLSFPQTTGTVIMTVDNHEERWHAAIHNHPRPTRIVTADLRHA